MKSATTKNAALRAQAILLSNDWGSGAKIQPLTGLTRTHAIDLKQRYLKEGVSCLIDKRKGKPKQLLDGAHDSNDDTESVASHW